jgi:transcription-repair coupling factor (superfamily II helicase)
VFQAIPRKAHMKYRIRDIADEIIKITAERALREAATRSPTGGSSPISAIRGRPRACARI